VNSPAIRPTSGQDSDRTAESPRSIYIVLATYNGARYLVEQIESLRSQTFTAWTLLVRDDGSSDATTDILADYAAADPRIEVIRDPPGNLGAAGNFSHLATVAFRRGASVVLFADQDDVWYPDKVARTIDSLDHAEARLGFDRPILVHTDLRLLDSDGRLRHRSFMAFQRIHNPRSNPLATLLVQNYVTGCAMAVNRPLLRFGLPVPSEALMHDWWLALCAASCGTIVFLPEATVAYRRHGTNTVAVRGFWRTLNPLRTDWRGLWHTGRVNHARAVKQATVLAERLAEVTDQSEASVAASRDIAAFVRLHGPDHSALSRVAGAVRLRLRSQAMPRTVALYIRLLRWGR
jgi:glycosyltransferase involved in cell wall biosynthesis